MQCWKTHSPSACARPNTFPVLLASRALEVLDVAPLDPSVPGPGLCVPRQQMDVKCSTPCFLTAALQGLLGHGDEAAPQGLELLRAEVLPQAAARGPRHLHTPALGHGPGPTDHQVLREGAKDTLHVSPHHSVP